MVKGIFELAGADKPESYPAEFIRRFQTALLLSLLNRDLLTRPQFERCLEELQKHSV